MISDGQPITVSDTELTKFLVAAECNTKLSLSQSVDMVKFIHEIDAIYSSFHKVADAPNYLLFSMFVSRCHGALLGAVRLLFGGQTTETYALLRLAIENALYAVYTTDEENLALWAQREASSELTKKLRKKFVVGNFRTFLEDIDLQLAASVDQLYAMSIDCGAHPNVEGHLVSSKFTDSGGSSDILAPGTPFWRITVQRTVRCGAVCLKVLSAAPQSRIDETTRTKISEWYEFTGTWKEFKSEVAQAEACGSES